MLVCGVPYKSYLSPSLSPSLSLSLSLMQLCWFNMEAQSIHSCWLIAAKRQPGQRVLAWAHRLQAAACFFFFFLHCSARLHVTWPHKRNWQRRELSWNINWMSQGQSARTVMAVSCITFSNTLCVGSQSGVILDLPQQVSRGEPDSQTIIRAVYCSKIRGAANWSQETETEEWTEEKVKRAFVVRRKKEIIEKEEAWSHRQTKSRRLSHMHTLSKHSQTVNFPLALHGSS